MRVFLHPPGRLCWPFLRSLRVESHSLYQYIFPAFLSFLAWRPLRPSRPWCWCWCCLLPCFILVSRRLTASVTADAYASGSGPAVICCPCAPSGLSRMGREPRHTGNLCSFSPNRIGKSLVHHLSLRTGECLDFSSQVSVGVAHDIHRRSTCLCAPGISGRVALASCAGLQLTCAPALLIPKLAMGTPLGHAREPLWSCFDGGVFVPCPKIANLTSTTIIATLHHHLLHPQHPQLQTTSPPIHHGEIKAQTGTLVYVPTPLPNNQQALPPGVRR